ncbi:hypothetical protein ACS0TY_019774 [Phlomoides rotata]
MGSLGLSHGDGQGQVSIQNLPKLNEWIFPTQHHDRKHNQVCQRSLRVEKGNDLGEQVDRDREYPTKGMQYDAC